MRKLILLLLFLFVAGCEVPTSDEIYWGFIKSPKTGRCYEVAKYGVWQQATMAMSEVPCREAGL